MATIVTVPEVQAWLNRTKFTVSAVEDPIEDFATGAIFGKLSQRYDTSTWISESTVPAFIKSLISMWYAGEYLRRTASEEDGLVSYAVELQSRVMKLCDEVVAGSITLPGVVVDTSTTLGAGPSFFPDDNATSLWENAHSSDGSSTEVGAATRAFDMQQRF